MEQELTIEERQKFWASLDRIDQVAEKVDEIYTELVGDPRFKRIGMIARLESVEEKIRNQERERIEFKAYLRGVIATTLFLGGALGSLITLTVNYIFK